MSLAINRHCYMVGGVDLVIRSRVVIVVATSWRFMSTSTLTICILCNLSCSEQEAAFNIPLISIQVIAC